MAKKRVKRTTREEPTLHVHRYIASVKCGETTKYKYLGNREEVRELARGLKKGQTAQVFAAVHNFVGSYKG